MEQHDHSTRMIRSGQPPLLPESLPIFYKASRIEISTHYRVVAHEHPDHEVFFVREGRYCCVYNGERVEVTANQGLCIAPGDRHEDCAEGPSQIYVVGFYLREDCPPVFAERGTAATRLFSLNQEMVNLLEELADQQKHGERFALPRVDALLTLLYWAMLRNLPESELNPNYLRLVSEESFAVELQRLFNRLLLDDPTVSEMAAAMGMSERVFSRKCREAIGDSPRRAFLNAKMRRASEFLERTDMSVKEVATHLGYDDPFLFSRAFKRHLGVSPDQWRRGDHPVRTID